jgi:hypothetical protein
MKRVVKDILNTDTTVSIQTLNAIIQNELTAGERLSKVKIPVHVITSEYAPANKAVMEKYCTAGFKEKIIRGTGHYPMIEQPAEFNRYCLKPSMILRAANEFSQHSLLQKCSMFNNLVSNFIPQFC